jgi:predicted nucleotidyltransferase
VAKVTVEERLRTYFEREPSVVMAFLFGSRVKGIERMGSDWDIGIYLPGKARDRGRKADLCPPKDRAKSGPR